MARPDSHAPIGVMGEHGHKAGEMMLAYRFMVMDMRDLQSGTDTVATVDVLKDFMMAPIEMDMRMHMFGVMFAPHDKITLMAMTSYQQHYMEMEGAHQHATGHHHHPIGIHEMSSAGIGDVKLDSLLTLCMMAHKQLACKGITSRCSVTWVYPSLQDPLLRKQTTGVFYLIRCN